MYQIAVNARARGRLSVERQLLDKGMLNRYRFIPYRYDRWKNRIQKKNERVSLLFPSVTAQLEEGMEEQTPATQK